MSHSAPDTPELKNIADIFKKADHAAKYADGPKRFVPGLDGLHRIMAQLVREAEPKSVLVLGGGGGLETRTLIDALPDARFCAVDPSAEMIAQGKIYLGETDQVDWIEGLIFDAPIGPFDAATCMLTLHFVPDDGGKLETLKAIRARLRPGAPFFMAHLSIDKEAPQAEQQFERYLTYAADSQFDPEQLALSRQRIRAMLNCVGPERDADLLREAGFEGIEMVFKGLYWCGWVAYA